MFAFRALGKSLVADVNKPRIAPVVLIGLTRPESYLKPEVLINFQIRERSSIRDLRKDFKWMRERPLGPHLHKPPNRNNKSGGHKAADNYHHIIHYPEDGKYTIKKLDGKF